MNAAGTDAKMRNTKESILEAQFTSGAGNWCTWMFGRDLVNWNNNFTWAKWVTPSRDLISAFKQEGDEVRFKESIVYYDCNWSNYYPSDNYPFMYKCRSANSSIIKVPLCRCPVAESRSTDYAGYAGFGKEPPI